LLILLIRYCASQVPFVVVVGGVAATSHFDWSIKPKNKGKKRETVELSL
jgi:hypothetical protein